MPQDIEIYIDRIVLEGFEHLNARQLNQTIQQHLTDLLIEQGLPQGLTGLGKVNKLNGGQIYLTSNPNPGQIGKSIANGIYQGINMNE